MKTSNAVAMLLLLCGLQACDRAATAPPVTDAATPPTTARTQEAAEPKIASAQPVEVNIDRIIDEVMRQQYAGGYDQKHQCWTYTTTSGDGASQYCMRARPAQLVDVGGVRQLHFMASSAADINDSRFTYSAIDSGLMGAFQVALAGDGTWKLLAAEKAMDFGTAGVCGCEDAEFVKLGKDFYGWTFTSGGMWQGIIVSNHEIVAPHDGRFKNLGAIPEIREEAQDIRYSIKVLDSGDPQQDVFPLLVEKMQSDKKIGEVVVKFDRNKWKYSEIGDF